MDDHGDGAELTIISESANITKNRYGTHGRILMESGEGSRMQASPIFIILLASGGSRPLSSSPKPTGFCSESLCSSAVFGNDGREYGTA